MSSDLISSHFALISSKYREEKPETLRRINTSYTTIFNLEAETHRNELNNIKKGKTKVKHNPKSQYKERRKWAGTVKIQGKLTLNALDNSSI